MSNQPKFTWEKPKPSFDTMMGGTPRTVKTVTLPFAEPPQHTKRIVVWHTDDQDHSKFTEGAHIYVIVGYCPDTVPYFMGLLEDTMARLPEINLNDINFGKVTNSRWCKGFTLLAGTIPGKRRDLDGFGEMTWDTLDLGF
jgi:hypothetical protein